MPRRVPTSTTVPSTLTSALLVPRARTPGTGPTTVLRNTVTSPAGLLTPSSSATFPSRLLPTVSPSSSRNMAPSLVCLCPPSRRMACPRVSVTLASALWRRLRAPSMTFRVLSSAVVPSVSISLLLATTTAVGAVALVAVVVVVVAAVPAVALVAAAVLVVVAVAVSAAVEALAAAVVVLPTAVASVTSRARRSPSTKLPLISAFLQGR